MPSGTFRTRDGRYAVIGGNGDSVFDRLMRAVGRADMGVANPRFATNPKRVEAEAEIMAVIGDWWGAGRGRAGGKGAGAAPSEPGWRRLLPARALRPAARAGVCRAFAARASGVDGPPPHARPSGC